MASRGLRFTTVDNTQDDPTMTTNSLALKLTEEVMALSRPKRRTPHNRGRLVDVHYSEVHRIKKRCPSRTKQSTSSTSVSSILG